MNTLNTTTKIIFLLLIAIVFYLLGRVHTLSSHVNQNSEAIFKNKEDINADHDSFSEDIQELFNYHLN